MLVFRVIISLAERLSWLKFNFWTTGQSRTWSADLLAAWRGLCTKHSLSCSINTNTVLLKAYSMFAFASQVISIRNVHAFLLQLLVLTQHWIRNLTRFLCETKIQRVKNLTPRTRIYAMFLIRQLLVVRNTYFAENDGMKRKRIWTLF